MEDLIQFQIGIETRQANAVVANAGLGIVAANAIVPTTWPAGMALARAAIERHTNQTEAPISCGPKCPHPTTQIGGNGGRNCKSKQNGVIGMDTAGRKQRWTH